ncbi:Protein of unknown function [Alteromonadaceae bacterium Bs31]|nr:Protein of unknown function [Alteromonadaceae bacterium Bs31]
MTIILVLAVLFIAVLSLVAIYLHWQLYQQKKERDNAKLALDQRQRELRKRNFESIEFIARAFLQEQLSATEASIRISVLSESLSLSKELAEPLSAFKQLAAATSHIPILDKWKALDKKQKREFEQQRLSHEGVFEAFVIESARQILENKASYLQHIESLDNPL